MPGLCSIGELLIDFTPAGVSPAGNALFERNPGGGPANLAVGASMLGLKASFMGKVGNDAFGRFLKETLESKDVDTRGLVMSETVNTTLAFVHLKPDGDRSFSFYRKPGADMMYSKEDIDFNIINECSIFHFSSVSLTDEPAAEAIRTAVEYAKTKVRTLSFDPNLRPPLWASLDQAKIRIASMLPYADILKISGEEAEFLYPDRSMENAADELLNLGISAVFITLGAGGCYYANPNGRGHKKTYDTKVVDTTGCGDAFMAAVLYRIHQRADLAKDISADEMASITEFANAAGACAASRRGGIPAMPDLKDVEDCLRNVPLL
jgi:fructokinase